MNENFLENWINGEHRVLGRRLHPFCLYDALALIHLESPFLDIENAGTVEHADLRWAVDVCSAPPGAALELGFYHRSVVKDVLTGLAFRFHPRQWSLFGPRPSMELRFKRECDAFVAYVDDFFRPPQTWNKGEASESGAPWPLAIATQLERNVSEGRHAIWSMPLGQALWRSVMIGIQDGSDAQFLTDEEETFLREAGLL